MRFLLTTLLALLLAVPVCAEDFSSVQISLTGGEVVGRTEGSGIASVSAHVQNNGERPLEGLRVGVYYSMVDSPPPPGATWHIHEFVFEPPLKPGGSSTLKFKDEDAAQYVLIETRRLKFTAALKYKDQLTLLSSPLLQQDGAAFIALRDLLGAVGGSLGNDSGYIQIERSGMRLRLKAGQNTALLNGASATLQHAVLDVNGRAYIALEDAARLLGLKLASDGAVDLYELREPEPAP